MEKVIKLAREWEQVRVQVRPLYKAEMTDPFSGNKVIIEGHQVVIKLFYKENEIIQQSLYLPKDDFDRFESELLPEWVTLTLQLAAARVNKTLTEYTKLHAPTPSPTIQP